jgi:hypothetical protein
MPGVDSLFVMAMMPVMPVPVPVPMMPRMPLVNFNHRESFCLAGPGHGGEGIDNERQQQNGEQGFHRFLVYIRL